MGLEDTWTSYCRARDGDDRARNELLERLRPRLFLWVTTKLSPALRAKIEADDLVQEVLVAAHRGLDGFRGEDVRGLHAWLFRIAENRIRDAVDHFQAQKRQPVDRGSLTQTSPSSAAVRREDVDRLRRAIDGLPDDYRQVILLRRIEAQEFEQVAEVMDRSVNAVRILYCRALKGLAEALEARAGETGSDGSR